MSMQIAVRPIELGDLPALYRLIPRLWIEQDITPTNDVWIDTSREFIEKHLGTLLIGAVAVDLNHPEEIVSCGFDVIWQQLPTFWNTSGKNGFLQWFYTAPNYRGQKLGDQIMRTLMDWFTARDITRVQLNATRKAIPFHERFGFELADEWPQMHWKLPDENPL